MLTSLKLNQFRCFDALRLDLGEGVTIFVGDNAEGKTSILEAVCVLLRLQSPRTSSLAECIRFETEGFALATDHHESELRLQFSEKRGRKLLLDGETQKRAGDYLRASELVVWMANDDLALIRGGADGRRRYLDFMAAQLFPDYRPSLRAYEKALRSRNFLLKKHAAPRWAEIDAYTRLLADHGVILTRHRRILAEKLQPFAAEAQSQISGRDESVSMVYESASGDGDDLAATLLARREEEFRKRQTAAGPHRDDLSLTVDAMPAAKFASEGQQRTLALALKLAQTRLFLEMRSRPPVMLIDDVFGELDPGRRNALMKAWPPDSQKLITTTHLDWLDDCFPGARILRVEDSAIQEEAGSSG